MATADISNGQLNERYGDAGRTFSNLLDAQNHAYRFKGQVYRIMNYHPCQVEFNQPPKGTPHVVCYLASTYKGPW
jgi:hypothetical protein